MSVAETNAVMAAPAALRRLVVAAIRFAAGVLAAGVAAAPEAPVDEVRN